MKRYVPYLHWTYYAHRIFPKIEGTHINSNYKLKQYRKYYIKIGWAYIKEGLINVLSRGIYTADYGIDTAFQEHPDTPIDIKEIN